MAEPGKRGTEEHSRKGGGRTGEKHPGPKNRYDCAIRTWGRAIFQNPLPLILGEAVMAGILSYIFNVPR